MTDWLLVIIMVPALASAFQGSLPWQSQLKGPIFTSLIWPFSIPLLCCVFLIALAILSNSLIYIIIFSTYCHLSFWITHSVKAGMLPGLPLFPKGWCHASCTAAAAKEAFDKSINEWMWMNEWASWTGGSTVEKNQDQGKETLSVKSLPFSREPLILKNTRFTSVSGSFLIRKLEMMIHSLCASPDCEGRMQELPVV